MRHPPFLVQVDANEFCGKSKLVRESVQAAARRVGIGVAAVTGGRGLDPPKRPLSRPEALLGQAPGLYS